jgi:hypothetical protein
MAASGSKGKPNAAHRPANTMSKLTLDLKDTTEKVEFLGGLGTAAKTILFLTLKHSYIFVALIDITVSVYRLFAYVSTYGVIRQEPSTLYYVYTTFMLLVLMSIPISAVAIQGILKNNIQVIKLFNYYKHSEIAIMPLYGLLLNLL